MRLSWFTNPVSVFIFSLLALGSSLSLYIHSYLQVNNAFSDFVRKRNMEPSQFLQTETWVTILVLSVLVAIILLGLLLIFIYYQKLIQMYRTQQNFINGFTHELKTPLASLRLFIDTFSKYELPRDEQLKYLLLMKRDTDRLSENVNEILNLAKIEDKKYEAEFLSKDLYLYLREWLDRSPHFQDEIDITLEKRNQGSFVCKLEPQLLDMMLSNLVNNAITYTNKERPTLAIRVADMGNKIEVDFVDNGIGLAKGEPKKIFRKFYQVGKSAKGSGLGLYLVMQIARFHKGNIRAESEGLNLGTKFTLVLPKIEVSQ